MKHDARPWARGGSLLLATALLATTALVANSSTTAVAGSGDPVPEAQKAPAETLSQSFRAASERAMPSVVAIENRPKPVVNSAPQRRPNAEPFGGRNPFEGTPFENFFDQLPDDLGSQGFNLSPGSSSVSIGSGVVIDESGVILTNNHVVAGDGEVTVRLHDGREFKATSVVTDPKTDLAIVRIEGADDLVAAPFADSEQVQVGDWVLALGQPFGLEGTVTAGIVSAMHRGIGITQRESFIQTDAAINPGNSGGPLVNLDGQIVGINTAISSRSGGNNGVGFAVPANLAKWVSGQLLADGQVHRAYLGVGIQPVTQNIAGQFGVDPREGVVVTQVFPDTPAAKMGLREGDVITSLDGTAVSTAQDLQLLVEQTALGKAHPMVVVRDGKRVTLQFRPEAQPEDFGAASTGGGERSVRPEARSGALGMTLDDLTPEVAGQLGVEGATGVVITDVEPNSAAARAGLEAGMVIRQIDRKAVRTAAEAQKILNAAGDDESVLLLVQSSEGSRFVVLNR